MNLSPDTNNTQNERGCFNKMAERGKVVITPQLAKYLLAKGYQIIDLKPDRNQKRNSVFIFRLDDGIDERIREFINSK